MIKDKKSRPVSVLAAVTKTIKMLEEKWDCKLMLDPDCGVVNISYRTSAASQEMKFADILSFIEVGPIFREKK